MIVHAGNVSLNVDERGSGEPALIFLHYWGGSRRTWNRVIDSVKDSFRCIAYDQRGWGESDAPVESYSVSDLADDASSLIKALGIQRYVLVGHSMGGKVVQLVASRNPVGLIGLVLVAPAPPTPVHFPEPMREQQIHAYDSRENVLQAIAFLTARPPAPEIVEQIVEDSLRGSPGAKVAWPTQAITEDISAEVSKIAVPTLVLAGEHDRVDSVEQHRREILPGISGSRLEVIVGSGHLSPIDEPEQVAAAILRFAGTLMKLKDSVAAQ
jgi:pimeloyl-ACP methyl ester carboxylesterase